MNDVSANAQILGHVELATWSRDDDDDDDELVVRL